MADASESFTLRPGHALRRTVLTQDAPTNDSGTLPISGVQLSGLARPVPRLVLAWSTAEGPPPGDRLVFERAGDEVALGRSTTGWNGADLADPAMSRHQATVRREGHKLVLHNHGGTNPTAVQGATLSTPRVLEEGDVVRMGNTLMVARYGSPAEDLGLRGETLGHSDAVRAAWRQMELLARIDKTALILGESGTGKELAARDIAALGHRRPLTAFNLANLPASLVAS